MTGETWRLGHRPALDGVRGIAVLLVILCHTDIPGFEAMGVVGVTMFFTLSGFLITALLIEERDRTGHVSFRRFYARRARRLFPALAVMLALTGVAMVALNQATPLLPVLGYYGNWVNAFDWTGPAHLGAWTHTWSLAVEEQFYFVWPVLALALLARWGRRGVLVACALGAAWSVVGRLIFWHATGDWSRSYYGTDMHLDALLLGAGLAAVMVGRAFRPWQMSSALAVVGLVDLGLAGQGFVAFVLMPGSAALLSVALVAAAAQSSPRWVVRPTLTWVGRRSYALYLWHYPLIILLRVVMRADVATVVAVVLTFVMAELSWRLVEQPFLRKRLPVTRSSEPSLTLAA